MGKLLLESKLIYTKLTTTEGITSSGAFQLTLFEYFKRK